MSKQDLETRLDAVESQLAIQRLVAEYGHAFDGHDEALLRSIWHEGLGITYRSPTLTPLRILKSLG
jgi:hypothetical protein